MLIYRMDCAIYFLNYSCFFNTIGLPFSSHFDSRLPNLVLPNVVLVLDVIEQIHKHLLIAVIAFAPTGKASFVYSYVQTRLKGQYNGK